MNNRELNGQEIALRSEHLKPLNKDLSEEGLRARLQDCQAAGLHVAAHRLQSEIKRRSKFNER